MHRSQRVVSTADSPVHRGPAMYSPALQDARHDAHDLSLCVRPVQKPTTYRPGGCASYDRQRPLHFAHTLFIVTLGLHSLRMYWPSCPAE